MQAVIKDMLAKYQCSSTDDYRNALKEIIQEITLLGLARGNFFDVAAFYGGTALRIFYGLDRFSEDIDFSLLNKSDNFDLNKYCDYVQNELNAYGFEVSFVKKEKSFDSIVDSAFIKAGTITNMLNIEVNSSLVSSIAKNEVLKIKLEVDKDPPSGASYEIKPLLLPIPFYVKLFSIESLFAGKLHAVLCRNWRGNRIKGRDLYDYLWYISRSVSYDLEHLEERMKQSGNFGIEQKLTKQDLIKLLNEKFDSINYEQAKNDVLPFIKNPQILDLWSKDFFIEITKDKLISI